MKKSIQLVAIVICFALGTASALASALYWDVNDTNAGSGQGATDGTWDVAQVVWNDTADGTGTVTNWPTGANGDTAVFSAGSDATDTFTVTLGDGVTGYIAGYNKIVFEEGNVTVKGTTFSAAIYGYLYAYDDTGANLGGTNATIEVQSGATATIEAPMGRTRQGITKTGPGTLYMTRSEGLAGEGKGFGDFANSELRIEEGVWSADDYSLVAAPNTPDSMAGRARVIVIGGASTSGTLEQTGGGSASLGSGGVAHTATILGAGGATINLPSGGALAFRCAGGVSGTGSLTISGNGGTVRIGAGGFGGGTWAGNTTVDAGMTLQNGNYDALPHGAGTGNILLNGTLDTWGTGTYCTINGLSGTGTVTASGAGATSGQLFVGDNDATSTFAGDIGDAKNFNLVKIGAGTLSLTSSNSMVGTVTNSAGGLVLSGDGIPGNTVVALGAATTLDVSGLTSPPFVIGSGGLDVQAGTNGTAALVGSATLSSAYPLGLLYAQGTPSLDTAGELSITANGTTITVEGGAITSGTTNVLISKSGSGSVTGTVGSYSIQGDGITGGGSPSLSLLNDELVLIMSAPAATLRWGGGDGTWSTGGAGWESGGTTTFADGDAVIFDETYSSGTPTITVNSGVSPAQIAVTNSGTVTEFTISGTGTIVGFSGVSTLIKDGTGTLTVAVPSTMDAGSALYGGQLNINNAGVLGSSLGTFLIGGGTIDNTSGGAITVSPDIAQSWAGDFTFAGSDDLNLGAGAVTLGASRQVTVSAGKLTVGGAISGTGFDLTKAGSGTLTLGGANTYSGITYISAGVLQLANSSALAGSTLDMNYPDVGTLSFGALSAATLGGLSGTNNIVLENDTSGAVALTVGANNGTETYNGNISGSGSLIKTGSGTWEFQNLGQSWTHTGGTTVSQGILVANRSMELGSNALVTVDGTIANAGRTITMGSLTGTGTITASGTYDLTTWVVGGDNTSTTFDGQILRPPAKNSRLDKNGTGTLTLTHGNSIGAGSGIIDGPGVHINAGTVVAAHGDTLGGYRVLVYNGSTLVISNVVMSSTLNAYLTNGATLKGIGGIASSIGSANRQTYIQEGGTVTIATGTSDDHITFAGAVTGGDANSLVQSVGPGTNNVAAVCDYVGNWQVTGGTLRLFSSGSIGTCPVITVDSGTLLDASGRTDGTLSLTANQTLKGEGTIGGILSGTGTVAPGTSVGIMTVVSNTWATGGDYQWEVDKADDAGVPGTDWDLLAIGDLTVTASAGNEYNIVIKPTPVDGLIPGVDKDAATNWVIANVSGTISGFSSDAIACDDLSVSNDLAGGSFYATVDTTNVVLNYTNNHGPSASAASYTRYKGTTLKIPLSDLYANSSSDPDGHGRVLWLLNSGANANQTANGFTVTTNGSYIYYTNIVNDTTDTIDFVVSDLANYRAWDTRYFATNTITIDTADSTGVVTVTGYDNTNITVSFYGIPGYDYVVQRGSNVYFTNYVDELVTNTAPSGGLIQYTDTSPPYNPSFYRIRSD